MAVEQPFKRQRVRGIRLEDAAAELGARWQRGALDRVEHAQRRGVTRDGDQLPYDALVIAIGARSDEWRSEGVLTYHDGRDGPGYRLLLHRLREGLVKRLAFVEPAGASWPLPLYDLALMTAADCAARELSEVELSLITPEEQPLGIFGNAASSAIRRLPKMMCWIALDRALRLSDALALFLAGLRRIPRTAGGRTSAREGGY